MNEFSLKLILEALIMAHDEPLSVEKMRSLFTDVETPTRQQIDQALIDLAADYEPRAIALVQLARGYTFQTRPAYASWVARLWEEKPAKYSTALLEVLSIVAYQQPVTRADIEDIRGVSVSRSMIKTLLDRGWIRADGYREVPGQPVLYVTTSTFLDYFNLVNLHDLPPLGAVEHEQ